MYYGKINFNDIANGVGVRVALFVSGCTNHCKECFNPETWNFEYGQEFTIDTENEILDKLKPDYINGLTVLGGEPFEPKNQRVLVEFLKRVKQHFPNKPIWCYSGFRLDDEILNSTAYPYCEVTLDMLKYIDVLVDGRFDRDLKNLSLNFRGSSNQRIILVQETLKQNKIVLSPLNN